MSWQKVIALCWFIPVVSAAGTISLLFIAEAVYSHFYLFLGVLGIIFAVLMTMWSVSVFFSE